VATLDIEREQLLGAPIFFARGTWPNLYEGEWAAKVHAHFGLDATRIERAYRTPEVESDRDGTKARSEEGLKPGDKAAQPRREQPGTQPREPKSAPSTRETKPSATPERETRPQRPEQQDESSLPLRKGERDESNESLDKAKTPDKDLDIPQKESTEEKLKEKPQPPE
jgi:hypothetical protein